MSLRSIADGLPLVTLQHSGTPTILRVVSANLHRNLLLGTPKVGAAARSGWPDVCVLAECLLASCWPVKHNGHK